MDNYNKVRVNTRKWFQSTEFFHFFLQRLIYKLKGISFKNYPWSKTDKKFKKKFLSNSYLDNARYDALFEYLLAGYLNNASSDYAYCYYPGAMSRNGVKKDAMEGFCRILPMLSAWISSGRPSKINISRDCKIDLLEIIRKGVISGTNPKLRSYWGDIGDCDPKTVEAADIAISLWLLKQYLWKKLSVPEKSNIVNWLKSVIERMVHDNNWQLFPIIVNEVLIALGYGQDHKISELHFERVKEFYKGNGWFSDGPNGKVDYYNSWGFHYSLFWINQINPEFDPEFINKCLNDFVANFEFFFQQKDSLSLAEAFVIAWQRLLR